MDAAGKEPFCERYQSFAAAFIGDPTKRRMP